MLRSQHQPALGGAAGGPVFAGRVVGQGPPGRRRRWPRVQLSGLVCPWFAFWSHSPGLACGDLVLGEGVGGSGDSDSPQALPQTGQLCPKPARHLAKQARHSSEPGWAVGGQPGPRCRQPVCGQEADRSAGGEPVSTAWSLTATSSRSPRPQPRSHTRPGHPSGAPSSAQPRATPLIQGHRWAASVGMACGLKKTNTRAPNTTLVPGSWPAEGEDVGPSHRPPDAQNLQVGFRPSGWTVVSRNLRCPSCLRNHGLPASGYHWWLRNRLAPSCS